ncbi:Bromodomain-containing protein [Xylariaceae sp. FL1651]|nr:Bromodomain-containing protein [Xylariaceae sp. FL1651]
MATEESQSPTLERKSMIAVPVDEMEVDEPAAKTVNGYTKLDGDISKPKDASTANGDEQSPTIAAEEGSESSHNHQAFATNNSLLDTSSKPTTDSPRLGDTEMTEANGTLEVEEKPSPVKAHKDESEDLSPTKTPHAEQEATSKEIVVDRPTADSLADSMDIDVSTERPDLASSAEHVDSTQDTSAMSDAQIVSSPQESSQPADLSKLDIKATQEAEDVSPTQADAPMVDSAASLAKVSREREEDDAEEPAAKRAKTEDAGENVIDSLVVASNPGPATPTPQVASESLDGAIPDDQPITPFQNRRTREVLGNVKKTKNGGNFRKSVQDLWPALWNDYRAKIDKPVDIALMEARLREDKYANYGQFKADVNQLYENAVIFNGPQHEVTRAAAMVREYILIRMPEIVQQKAPLKPEKGKAQPTRHTEPRAATQPRRQSQSQTQAPATSPKPKSDPSSLPTPASATAQAFAIPPSGIPQIRRDSTRDDNDRPKRPIHPPKNRDPEYSSKASRKKKLDPEQRFFETVLEEVKKVKHYAINQWFMAPVDPVALNIPNYFKIIKKPMDLATMTEKNYDGEYKTMKDMEKDMKLIVNNAELFNGVDHEVSNQARQLEELLKTQLAGKDKWMERHYPSEAPSAAHASAVSPERSIAESEDESEAEGEEQDNEAIRGLQQRLNEEQDKLNVLLNSKKPDLTMMEIQQQMVTMLQRKLVEEKTKFLSEKKPKSKKKSSGSKSKSKTSGGNLAGAGSKKSIAAASTSKKPSSHSKKPVAPKRRAIGALEKAVIAEGINELDGSTLTKAVEIIKRDTGQNENDDGEMELDIDSLTPEALGKLYDLINKAHPNIRQSLAQKPEYSNAVSSEAEPKAKTGSLPKAKKNKPMNKHEQERKIEQLRELKAQLQRHGSGSQEPIPADVDEQPAGETSEESDSEEE